MCRGVDPEPERLAEALGPGWDGLDAAVVLGSGLGRAIDDLGVDRSREGADLAGWGPGSVPGHRMRLSLCRAGGRRILVFEGRRHLYEGLPMGQVAMPARLAATLGARLLVLFSAVGGVDPSLAVGSWVFVTDHLNWMGRNPLEGVQTPSGPAFVDLTRVYRTDLLEPVGRAAAARGIAVESGVLAAFSGPTYETPAEVRWARQAGAAVVGMSTVPEAVWARYLGLDVVALARVVNPAAGLAGTPLDHGEVVREGERGAAEAAVLIESVLDAWGHAV